MISIEEINNLQKDIDRKDRIIKVLKERVRQWVKEYNILDDIIEVYKMSENEANEIIAELEAYKDVNEDFKTAWEELKAENIKFTLDSKKLVAQYSAKLERLKAEMTELEEKFLTLNGKSYSYYTTLQEIKTIVCGNYEIIDPQGRKDILKLITKAEEE